MSIHKARRRSARMQRRGLMVVHSRWLSFDGEVPAAWTAWSDRRFAGGVA